MTAAPGRLAGLATLVAGDRGLAGALAAAGSEPVPGELELTGPPALRPFLVAGLVGAGRTVLAATATQREAEELVTTVSDLVDPQTVSLYPAWETLPHERLSPRSDTVGRRRTPTPLRP